MQPGLQQPVLNKEPMRCCSAQPAPATIQIREPESLANKPAVQISTNCPPSILDCCFAQVDELLIHKKAKGFQGVRYDIVNSRHQQVFYALEERTCCGNCAEFTIQIFDNTNHEIICVHGGSEEIQVEGPPGVQVGFAVKRDSFCRSSSFEILDMKRSRVFSVVGPSSCCASCCEEYEFDILSAGKGWPVGRITRQYCGLWKEAFTDADNFAIWFPIDLDVRLKATLLGVLFMIDATLIERRNHSI